jgi:hypothetical protein
MGMLVRKWPVVVAGVVILGAGIAIVQQRPDPLAAYGAFLAAITLAFQLQRATRDQPDLRMSVFVDTVNKIPNMLVVRAHNEGGEPVTLHAIGFWHRRDDPRAQEFGVESPAAHVERRFPRELTVGGARFEMAFGVPAVMYEAGKVGVPAPRFVWLEDGRGHRTWVPIPKPWIASIERGMPAATQARSA